MSRLATSFVLGYHGCDLDTAEQILSGAAEIQPSNTDFDWLGPGAYFWESDPRRALEWADWKISRGAYRKPAVIGAVIDLRNCLDLLARDDLQQVRAAHQSFLAMRQKSDLGMPENKSVLDQPDIDRVLRYLDCAVIKHLHEILSIQAKQDNRVQPFDTVRGMFTEGGALYEGSAFLEKTHVQIAVINSSCIFGYFRPRPYPT